jgi:hypothetical protein
MDTILVQDQDASSARLGDNEVVLDIRAGCYLDLNQTGGQIWRMLAEPCRVDRIFDELSRTYDIGMDVMQRDVTKFLQRMVDKGLVRVVGAEDRA